MNLAHYLGKPSAYLLEAEPFRGWPVERHVDNESDPPEVGYVLTNVGLEFRCDSQDERVRTLFVTAAECQGIVLSEIPLYLCREDILERFGTPSKCGKGSTHPVLGNSGPWDRFQRSAYTLHVEYRTDADSIQMITSMRNDVVPRQVARCALGFPRTPMMRLSQEVTRSHGASQRRRPTAPLRG